MRRKKKGGCDLEGEVSRKGEGGGGIEKVDRGRDREK